MANHKIRVHLDTDDFIYSDIHVDTSISFVPRVGDMLQLSENNENALNEQVMKSKGDHRYYINENVSEVDFSLVQYVVNVVIQESPYIIHVVLSDSPIPRINRKYPND